MHRHEYGGMQGVRNERQNSAFRLSDSCTSECSIAFAFIVMSAHRNRPGNSATSPSSSRRRLNVRSASVCSTVVCLLYDSGSHGGGPSHPRGCSAQQKAGRRRHVIPRQRNFAKASATDMNRPSTIIPIWPSRFTVSTHRCPTRTSVFAGRPGVSVVRR